MTDDHELRVRKANLPPPGRPGWPGPLALLLAALACAGHSRASAGEPDRLEVTPPPETFFERVRERDRDVAREFYRKHLDIGGLSVAASREVSDRALVRTHEIVSHMLAGRPDVLKAMVERGMYLVIIGKDQVYTDLPENRHARNPDYLNERVRGTGGLPTSFGEENLLSLSLDRYDDESIAVHEFCHTIDSTLARIDPTWRERKRAVYRRAIEKGLYKDTYAAGNVAEYWAEIAQSYFDANRVNNWNHGPIGRREQLRIHDPEGYELVRSTFRLGPDQDWRYCWLQELPRVEAPPARFGIDPWYAKFTWAREFTVLGRGARDEALLAANDTIRKMFAYRHDILKALIQARVRLVVLGAREKLSDIPEYGSLAGPLRDPTIRFLEDSTGTGLLVVGEESLPGSSTDPYGCGSLVIRVFARALHRVTAARPVDPNWERRGREVQQYELRVQRLDVRFDEELGAIFERARSEGRWKGTAAVHDRVSYWIEGVLAYFDATGRGAPPVDAEHPIATREALARYDPGLFALVEKTMAYRGKVDWRWSR